MIPGEDIETCPEFQTAVLQQARAANRWLRKKEPCRFTSDTRKFSLDARLRYMVFIRGPTETEKPTNSDSDSDMSMLLDYDQVPNGIARMVVQIPCTYSASVQGTVSASLDDHSCTARTFHLDSGSQESFQYVFSYTQSTTRIHAPHHGCAVFLLFDVVCLTPVCEPLFKDHHAAKASLKRCLPFWDQDMHCEKLALVLDGGSDLLISESSFCLESSVLTPRDRAVLRMLMSCEELDVAFAGGIIYVCM
jgi:hypothetical protein